jgi:RNA polymerase sigma factor (sigma-70 family)
MTPPENKKLSIVLTKAYKDYAGKLKKYAFFKLSNPVLGQELVQDTFLKTWKYLLRGGRIKTMQAFLYRILNDLIVDEYRKHKTVSLDALNEQGFEPAINEVPKLINKLDGKKALHLIRKLPQKYQKILTMRFVHDMTLKEISEVNGQSENTNSVQIRRGIKMIKVLSKNKRKSRNTKTPEHKTSGV